MFVENEHLSIAAVAGIGNKFRENMGCRRFNGALHYTLAKRGRRAQAAKLLEMPDMGNVQLPKVVNLALASMFSFIGDQGFEHPELCTAALTCLLSCLEGLEPGTMRGEPPGPLDELESMLVKLAGIQGVEPGQALAALSAAVVARWCPQHLYRAVAQLLSAHHQARAHPEIQAGDSPVTHEIGQRWQPPRDRCAGHRAAAHRWGRLCVAPTTQGSHQRHPGARGGERGRGRGRDEQRGRPIREPRHF